MQHLNEAIILDVLKPGVQWVNTVMTSLIPNGEGYLLIVISIVLAYIIKTRNGWGKIPFLFMAFVIFGFLRYLGILN